MANENLIPSDILSVLDHYGIEYKPSGSLFSTCCIFHHDDTPSMMIYPDTNSFYCFGCHTSGTPENIVMHEEGCSYAQAVKLLYGAGYEWFKLRKKTTQTATVDMNLLYTSLGNGLKQKLRSVKDDTEKLFKLKGLLVKYLKNGVEPTKLYECLMEIQKV